MDSISFDRAADFYDQTRTNPPGVAEQIASSLRRALEEGADILEIGVGTGRIAIPMIALDFNLTGLDLSARMMKRLRQKITPGTKEPSLIQGDAAALPFVSRSFDAILAVHVFHLIAPWRQSLQEIRRVLRPNGSLLVGYDFRSDDSPHARIRNRWRQIVRQRLHKRDQPGVGDSSHLKDELLNAGASMEEWVATEWIDNFNPAEYIQSLSKGVYSSTWRVPAEQLPEWVAELRLWAEEQVGELEQDVPVQRQFLWQRFTWPTAG